jgi:nitroreductase
LDHVPIRTWLNTNNFRIASYFKRDTPVDVFDAISERYSYRGGFSEQTVSREDLRKIVQAGLQAPSGCNEQTTSFVIIDDAQLMAKIVRIINRPVCDTARAMIVCVADPRPTYKGLSFQLEDCAAAVQNMLLAVTALGYATVWLDGVLRMDDVATRLNSLLDIPEGKTIQVVLPLGVAVKEGKRPEKLAFEKRAWFNRYGG